MLNLVAGCAGPQWPRTQAHVEQSFLRGTQTVYSVDVLPPDVQVWTQERSGASAEELAIRLDGVMRHTIDTALLRRGYHVLAQIKWDGTYVAPDGSVRQAMYTDHLGVTAYSLSGYGHAVEAAGQGLLVPYLPHRLGRATGADATLYVGGWAYVGKDPNDSKAAKIAKGIVIGILVVALVAILIIALDSGGKGLGKAASGVGKAAASATRSAARVAVTAGRAAVRTATHVTSRIARGMFEAADAFGHVHTHLHFYPGRPRYYEDDRTPKRGRSRMLLEMTLVDNRTGMVLWHSRETFPAHAPQAAQVRRALTSMLSTLPAH